MADTKRGNAGKVAIYIGITLVVVGSVFGYRLYKMHQQNVEMGDQMIQQADQMNKLRQAK